MIFSEFLSDKNRISNEPVVLNDDSVIILTGGTKWKRNWCRLGVASWSMCNSNCTPLGGSTWALCNSYVRSCY